MEEVNPNIPLPKVTKSLDFELIKKNSALYSDTLANKDGREISLNETQLTFTSPVVYGFSLADKRWRERINHLVLSLRYQLRLCTGSVFKHRARQSFRME